MPGALTARVCPQTAPGVPPCLARLRRFRMARRGEDAVQGAMRSGRAWRAQGEGDYPKRRTPLVAGTRL